LYVAVVRDANQAVWNSRSDVCELVRLTDPEPPEHTVRGPVEPAGVRRALDALCCDLERIFLPDREQIADEDALDVREALWLSVLARRRA
jgi:hypothetical protein